MERTYDGHRADIEAEAEAAGAAEGGSQRARKSSGSVARQKLAGLRGSESKAVGS